MAVNLVIVYTVVALIAAVIVYTLSARLGDERRPTPERLGLSLAAGIFWPIILLGVVELSSLAMYAKVHDHDEDAPRVEVLV